MTIIVQRNKNLTYIASSSIDSVISDNVKPSNK